MSKKRGFVIFVILAPIIVAGLLWWLSTPNSAWTTAKEAYSIAVAYALAGEPDARLKSVELIGYWSDSEELQGKTDKWTLNFCAPDQTYITLEVHEETVFLPDPWNIQADKKEPSELWEEARAEGWTTNDTSPGGEWVDSVDVFRDALARAQGEIQEDIELYEMKLHSYSSTEGPETTWIVIFCEKGTPARAISYTYDGEDGSYIEQEEFWLVG